MKRLILRVLLMTALALPSCPLSAGARGYSSGSHSYSSHSSSSLGSHSFSSHSGSSGFSSHSFSSGGSSSSSHTFSSSSGRSYSSGSSHDDSSRHSYSSGRSYGSGADSFFSSGSTHSTSSSSGSSRATRSASDDFHFDTAAARARKEETSKDTFTQYKESTAPKPPPIDSGSPGTTRVNTRDTGYSPPRSTTTYTYNSYHRTVYVPDAVTLSTRGVRIGTFFQPYYSRPIILYNDPYSSLFWWWLLDQSADQRALWAYNHRADMDAARYQALVAQDAQLESRVQQLEAQQVAVDPNFVPAGLDQDLMYTDDHVQQAYDTRATARGRLMFWIFAPILVCSLIYVFVYLVFFKRWHVSPQPST